MPKLSILAFIRMTEILVDWCSDELKMFSDILYDTENTGHFTRVMLDSVSVSCWTMLVYPACVLWQNSHGFEINRNLRVHTEVNLRKSFLTNWPYFIIGPEDKVCGKFTLMENSCETWSMTAPNLSDNSDRTLTLTRGSSTPVIQDSVST